MQSPKTLLPPGPWHMCDNEVRDGYGNVIAHIIYKRFPHAIGEWIAELPRLVELPDMVRRIEELEAALKEADEENDELENRIEELERDLAEQNTL